MPNDDKHLTGLYDPDAAGHSLLEFYPMDELPQGIPASVDGQPVVVLRYMLPEQYPENLPTNMPVVAIDVYTDVYGEDTGGGALLFKVYRDLLNGAAAVQDAARMLAQ